MTLRNHQLMNYDGFQIWPPVWVNASTVATQKISGEVGVLVGTKFYTHCPTRLYLVMELELRRYMGCLVFSEAGFCQHLNDILQAHIGREIRDIGDLELPTPVPLFQHQTTLALYKRSTVKRQQPAKKRDRRYLLHYLGTALKTHRLSRFRAE